MRFNATKKRISGCQIAHLGARSEKTQETNNYRHNEIGTSRGG